MGLKVDGPLIAIDICDSEGTDKWINDFEKGLEAIDVAFVVVRDNGEREKLYEAADVVVAPGATAGLLEQIWKNGAVPVAQRGVGVVDYDPIKEKGNGFGVGEENLWEFFSGVVKAVETFKFPYDWKHLLGNCC